MKPQAARKWLIHASLGTTAGAFLFFLVAPVAGFPLTFEQSLRLLEILLPVFLGYLGSATHFVLRGTRPQENSPKPSRGQSELLGLLVRGPVVVFVIVIAAAITAFGIANGSSAPPGSGMSVETLAITTAAALGLLTVTTSALVAALFPW